MNSPAGRRQTAGHFLKKEIMNQHKQQLFSTFLKSQFAKPGKADDQRPRQKDFVIWAKKTHGIAYAQSAVSRHVGGSVTPNASMQALYNTFFALFPTRADFLERNLSDS